MGEVSEDTKKGCQGILVDKAGTILSWNNDFEKLEGYSESEIIGQNFSIFYLPEERQAKLPEKLIKTALIRGKARHIGRHVRKNGTTFWGSLNMVALKDENKEVLGFTEMAPGTLEGND
jgi:PAS domain S-box-containing protein